MYSGDIPALITHLEKSDFKHAYIDGGATITAFINLELINELSVTRAPVLLGGGLPLFGKTNRQIKLGNAQAKAFPNDFIQVKYTVSYH
jgi:dihydrofolate reductase